MAGHSPIPAHPPLPAGSGNIDSDPALADVQGGNFQPKVSSPCVNTGQNSAWMETATDLNGNHRIRPAAGVVDMGCYEYQPGVLDCGFTADPAILLAGHSVVFTAVVSGTNTSGLYYEWDFYNEGTIGESGTGKAIVTNKYDTPGVYSIALSVTNAVGEIATTVQSNMVVASGPVIYVSQAGSGEAPYTSWGSAANEILDALDIAPDGVLVLVTNGTYSGASVLRLQRAIELRSVNGFSNTFISGSLGTFSMTHADAVLDGFSVTNGYAPVSGGGAVYMTAGSVKNCLFDRCSVPAGRKGAAVYMTGGVVLDSVFRNNYRAGSPSGAIQGSVIHVTGGLVERCIIRDNTNNCAWDGGQGAVYGGTFRSCLFFNNLINGSGGATYSSRLQNCTVASNTARTGGGVFNSYCTNSIVYFNTATNNPATDNWSGGTFAYSCTDPVPAGTGNIAGPPIFLDKSDHPYSLTAESPGINAGLMDGWMAGEKDLAGNPRISKGFVDMGAYELKSARSIIVKMK